MKTTAQIQKQAVLRIRRASFLAGFSMALALVFILAVGATTNPWLWVVLLAVCVVNLWVTLGEVRSCVRVLACLQDMRAGCWEQAIPKLGEAARFMANEEMDEDDWRVDEN